LTEWIRLQNDAGIGARAELIPMEAEEGILFLGFDVNEPGSFVYDQEQFVAHINGGGQVADTFEPMEAQGMGGMGGMNG